MASGDNHQIRFADAITERVIVALRRIIRAIDLHSRSLVNRYGLTGPQLAVLKELSRRGGVPICELARVVHLSQATVTGILARLERRDLIRRSRSHEDKRRVLVWLTRAGVDMLSHAPPPLREEFSAQFGKLEDWEQTQILSSLQRVVSLMEAKDLDVAPMLTTGPVDAIPEGAKAFLGKQTGSTQSGNSGGAAPNAGGTHEKGLREEKAATENRKGGEDACPGDKAPLAGPDQGDPL